MILDSPLLEIISECDEPLDELVQGGGGVTDGQRHPLPNGNLMQQSGHRPFRHPGLSSLTPKSFKGYRYLSILNYLPKLSTRTAPDTTLINHKSAITSQSKKLYHFLQPPQRRCIPHLYGLPKAAWKDTKYCPLKALGKYSYAQD